MKTIIKGTKRILSMVLALVMMLALMPMNSVEVKAETATLAGTVTITGTLKYNETLTADTSGITNNTGTLSYEWLRDDAVISGVTSSTYTLVEADIAHAIKVKVTSSVETGFVMSEATDVVEKADGPVAPNVTGIACTATDNNDGKITGTTTDMEYSSTAGFSTGADCTESEVTGLNCGLYFVRVKETATHKAGASKEVMISHKHVYSDTWTVNATTHYHTCTATAGRQYCNAQSKDEAAHSGGTATCQARAVCDVCSAEYGSLAAHSWGAWNATTGKRECQTAGCTEVDTCTHTGGAATCQTSGTCSICGTTYYADHDWAAWNATTGVRACQTTGCTETETCPHTGVAAGSTCGVCGKAIPAPQGGSSSSASTAAVTKTESPKVEVPVTYAVVKGDTLSKIAKRNGLTLKQIIALNPQIKNPNKIRIGQTINLGTKMQETTATGETATTTASEYVVVKGDTLSKIAKRNGLKLAELVAKNPDIVDINKIFVGQKIKL